MIFKKYVNAQYYENLRRFKYNGQNLSILYNWILGDIAQWVVDQLPKTVAPNLITITGFCNLLTSFALIFILNPMFDQDLPQWASLYIAWTIFVYQTLDNADGKQARRTKQSTALGMLMDHGSDCTATWIAGLLYINAFKVSFTPFNMLTAIGVSFLGFYFGVYCQQHTGVFQLGVINGVDEGLPILQLFFLIHYFILNQLNLDINQIKFLLQLQSCLLNFGLMKFNSQIHFQFNIIQCYFASIGTIIQFCYPVFKKMNWNIVTIIKSLSLPITLMITFICLTYISPTNVLSKWFHIYVLTIGLQWSKMINLWQLAIITKETFSQFSFTWALTLGSIMLNLISQFLTTDGFCYFDEVKLIFALLAFSFLSYLHCVTSIVHELCDILDIYAFSIKYPQ